MKPKVLYCQCAYSKILPEDNTNKVLANLKRCDSEILVVPDLCKLCAQKDPVLKKICGSETLIFACYPRAVEALLKSASLECPAREKIGNQREGTCEKQLAFLSPGLATFEEIEDENQWIPWFPVIDRKRCHNCKQCLNFCLFGVYELDPEGQVQVVKPQNCKTNCPACARICPELAVIFPKYTESPIQGAEITNEAEARQKNKENLESALGKDPYAALLARRQKRRERSL